MKVLYTKNQWTLAIYDDSNYVLYDNTKPKVSKTGAVSYKFWWFGSLTAAIREVSRRLADEACTDLPTWVEAVRGYHAELEAMLTV